MAPPLNPPVGGEKREPQVAVVPLDLIQVEDVGLGAANFDAWLQEISGGVVTLERIKTFAGGLPVVGNIMALVDALNDIARLATSEKRDPLDWVSLGINLIGMIPIPPGMAAARMTLRPMLFLVRQEMRQAGKMVLGDALIEILIGHLNATIVGTLDDFVSQAQGKLPGILEDAGALGEGVLFQIADGLESLVDPKLNAKADLLEAEQRVHATGDLWAYDPKAAIGNIFVAAAAVCVAAGKGAVNGAAEYLVPEAVKKEVGRQAKLLRDLAPQLRTQITGLADPGAQHSIAALLVTLEGAVVSWRARNGHGQSFNIKPGVTNQAKRRGGEGKLEAVQFEKPANALPNDLKDCACATTIGSISFAMGSESVSHTDFSLPGPFPIEWTRTYCSSLDAFDEDVVGARWITPFTTRFDLVGDGLVFHDADGRSQEFPLPKVKLFHFNAIENLTVVRLSKDRLLLMRGLEHRETYVRRGKRFVLINKMLPNGAGVMLHHEHQHDGRLVLSELVTYSEKDLNKVHLRLGTLIDDQGRLTGVWEVRDGDVKRQLCAYQYDDYCDLVLAQDENGAAWRYEYQNHLITRYTDRTNRGLNLQWQGTGPDAKAVREWADDGSFDTRLAWDENIRLTYVTDALGHETRHYYDSLGYTYRICHADGRSEWFFRDSAKNIIRHVHTDGSTDRYRYDKLSNLTEHTRADHSVMNYAYDDKSHLIKI
ncbi:MAG: RHS repeat protein, partial [Pseudomonas sp.]